MSVPRSRTSNLLAKSASSAKPDLSQAVLWSLAALLILFGIPVFFRDPEQVHRSLLTEVGLLSKSDKSIPFLLNFRNLNDKIFLIDRVARAPVLYKWMHVVPAFIMAIALPLQHIKWLRNRYPRFHHWVGYYITWASLLLIVTGLAFPALGLSHSSKGIMRLHALPGTSRLYYPSFNQALIFAATVQLPTLFMTIKTARARQYHRHRVWAKVFTIAANLLHIYRVGFLLALLIGATLRCLPTAVQRRLHVPETVGDKSKFELLAFELSTSLSAVLAAVWLHCALRQEQRPSIHAVKLE